MFRNATRLAILLALSFLSSKDANAGYLFNIQSNPTNSTLQTTGPNAGSYVESISSGSSVISLISNGGTDDAAPPYGTNFVMGYLAKTSTAPSASPDTLNIQYAFDITLTDLASGQSGTIVMSGVLTGTVSSLQANLLNTYTGQLTQSIILGDVDYTVDLSGSNGSFTPPGGGGRSGSFGGYIIGSAIPEPSSILLVTIGMLGPVGLAARRKFARLPLKP